MERGRRENVGADCLHYRRVKPTVFFEKQEKIVSGLFVCSDVFNQKFGNRLGAKRMKATDQPRKPDFE